jgi:hypothetical protein
MPISKSQDLPRRGGGWWPLFGGRSSSVQWGDHEGRVTVIDGADESWVCQGLDSFAGSGPSGITHRKTLVGELSVTVR